MAGGHLARGQAGFSRCPRPAARDTGAPRTDLGDDARHFEGNFDLAAVMDFADFDSARVYVQHPLHQAYVHDHASKVVAERVIVQHEWTSEIS